jgi:tripartite-type tricarboxylate transporter receptor subunit TctC
MYSIHHLAIEQFATCKGLKFKHIPVKGGAETSTMLIGKHIDFTAASSSHVPFFKQGVFRLLAIHAAEKRDPAFPDVPTIGDLGCPDVPSDSFILLGPKGMHDAVAGKLEEAFLKTVRTPAFRRILENYGLVYEYKDRKQVEKDIPVEYQRFEEILKKMGTKKEG